jgi:hypothetical protein
MIRLTRNFGLAVAILLMVPLSAQALSISVSASTSSGASTTLLAPGDTLTFDLVVENASAAEVFGLTLGARGYDLDANGVADEGLSFVGGSVTSSVFNTFSNPGTPNTAFGGLLNQLNAPVERGFFNTNTFNFAEKRAVFFDGVDTVGRTGDGTFDVGTNGDFVSNGAVHFQVSFEATPIGQTAGRAFTLVFGTMDDFGEVAIGNGGNVISVGSASYNLTVIPEPGTALLLGLGLAGLATRRQR